MENDIFLKKTPDSEIDKNLSLFKKKRFFD
jgi:hypothetical protein